MSRKDSNILSLVKIDDGDDRFKALKSKLLSDLKDNIICENYDPILNYVFEVISKENCSLKSLESEFVELFEEKAKLLLNSFVSSIESIYLNPNSSKKGNSKVKNTKNQKDQRIDQKDLTEVRDRRESKDENPNNIKDDKSQSQQYPRKDSDSKIDINSNSKPEKDLLDEFYEEENKNRSKNYTKNNNNQNSNPSHYPNNNPSNYPNNYNNRRNYPYKQDNKFDKFDPDYNRRHQTYKDDFVVGGKKVVLKNSKKEDGETLPSNINNFNNNIGNSNNAKKYRDRSREEDMYNYNNYYLQNPYAQSQFAVPRGMFRNPGMGIRFPMQAFPRGGMRPGFNRPPPRRFVNQIEKLQNPNSNIKEENQNENENININKENLNSEGKEPVPSSEGNNQTQPVEGEENKNKKKLVRCKKWPVCKNDNCEFVHPTETCKFFPKCTFGDSCINIHPNIPCKYGAFCARANCAYSHSTLQPRMPYFGTAFPMRQKKPSVDKSLPSEEQTGVPQAVGVKPTTELGAPTSS